MQKFMQAGLETLAQKAAKPLDSLPIEVHLADVRMLRLKRPTSQFILETYQANNPDHPKVTLVMLHAEQCWKIGDKFIPFNHALEFELA